MLAKLDLKKVLFLDIETVPKYGSFNEMSDVEKDLWSNKAKYLVKEDETAESIYNRAGIYAEFGKIVCISVGYLYPIGEEHKFRIKSFFGLDEKVILREFSDLLNNHFSRRSHILCAHNGKEFDFPYISRRMLINRLPLPIVLDNAGKKPWQIPHLDTMELWRFGDYKHYTSLALLANLFEIETPKDDIDGSQIWSVFWQDNDLDRIVTYCQKDMMTVAQILLSYSNSPLIEAENIEYV